MKKILSIALALCMLLALGVTAFADDAPAVAMITDYGDITDQSFNQTTYEACKAFADANKLDFQYYKPASDSDEDRITSIEKAIDDGYTVIVMPGYAFGPAIQEVAPEYDDITFIALDVSEGDIGDLAKDVPANLYCAVYQEELCGYMAGYASGGITESEQQSGEPAEPIYTPVTPITDEPDNGGDDNGTSEPENSEGE